LNLIQVKSLNPIAGRLEEIAKENRSSWGEVAADLAGDDLRRFFWL
jgi:hypothetical protein